MSKKIKKARIKLFGEALVGIAKLMKEYPNISQFASLSNQLNYLLELEKGNRDDFDRLNDIIIGIITAREVEIRDMDLADLLYDVVSEVDEMKQEYKSKLH